MEKANLSRMNVEALMELRKRVGRSGELYRLAWWEDCSQCARKLIEGEEGRAEVSWSWWRTVGGTRRNTTVVESRD
jgi:hypothetical protein